jgi:hypothetical protein
MIGYLFRWAMRISLGFMAVLGATIAVSLILNPNNIIFIGVILQHIFGNTRPPPIAKDQLVGMNWGTEKEASERLTALLQQKFPTGSREAGLRSTLLSQGFEPAPRWDCLTPGQAAPIPKIYIPCPANDRTKVLAYHWGDGICAYGIKVKWSVGDSETIEGVRAIYYSYCL